MKLVSNGYKKSITISTKVSSCLFAKISRFTYTRFTGCLKCTSDVFPEFITQCVADWMGWRPDSHAFAGTAGAVSVATFRKSSLPRAELPEEPTGPQSKNAGHRLTYQASARARSPGASAIAILPSRVRPRSRLMQRTTPGPGMSRWGCTCVAAGRDTLERTSRFGDR